MWREHPAGGEPKANEDQWAVPSGAQGEEPKQKVCVKVTRSQLRRARREPVAGPSLPHRSPGHLDSGAHSLFVGMVRQQEHTKF